MGVGTMTYAAVSSSGRLSTGHRRECRRPACLALAVVLLAMATGACAQSDHPKAAASQPATPKTLEARIAVARPGETVLLAGGDYGALSIGRRRFAAPGVVIAAAPGANAVFSSIEINETEGVTIKGVDVDVATAGNGVYVGNSSRITLAGLKIHAPSDASPNAIMLRYAHDVIVEDCDIRSVGFGVAFLNGDHIKILRNTFTDLQVDAIRGASSYVEVVGNRASSFHPRNGDHPDFIQFWGDRETGPSKANVIKGNVYERGDGDVVQGIFLEDNDDVVISGNAMAGTMYNAISLSRVHRALIEDNFVQGYDDMGTRIITRGWSSDVTVRNNVSQSIVNYADDGKPNPNYKEEDNRSIRSVKVGDTRDLQAWLAKRPTP